ncbi:MULTISPECIES: Eco57I restriction-modification methylase domain-containing protein [unclassified Haloferax]|uniref:Eco57I restriction-modification methylase domain-containing protein n=1 Tax=unclassified Haloferax TaxID=2625095 RepID=UPI00126738C0|nr:MULTISPECIES: N-6 DNA methylase [unclassified Haloferax]
MSAEAQNVNSMDEDAVLRVLEQYALEELEANLVTFYLDTVGVDYSRSDFLNNVTSLATDQDISNIVQTLFGRTPESISLNSVLRVFELAVEEEEREINGVYYTPEKVINYILEQTIHGDDTVCDCACGAGAFLVQATTHLRQITDKSIKTIIRENVYGSDILENNVRETKIALSLLAAENGELVDNNDFNIIQADALRQDWNDAFPEIANDGGFDVIVGNPPYVNIQTMDEELKEHVLDQYDTVQSGNFNTYIPFIELGIELINEGGKVGYILPLNYFTTLTGEDLREYLQDGKYVSEIVDFGDTLLFDDALTYTAISIFSKSSKSSFDYIKVDSVDDLNNLPDRDFIDIKYSSIDSEKWRLLDEDEFSNIRKIESFQPLDEVSGIHTGIATLKDSVYIVDAVDLDNEYFTITYEGETYRIEKEITEELVKISAIEASSDLKNNAKRIIVPYKKQIQRTLTGDGKQVETTIIPEDELKEEFPGTYEYLEAARDELATREKGDGVDYEPWYKYGREQGLEYIGERLYTPTYSSGPKFLHHETEYSLFANGYAVFPKTVDIEILERILNSKVMDYYIRNTSKEIQGDFQCYQKNFIRKFSVPEFSSSEKDELRSLSDQKEIDQYLIKKYGLSLEVSN